MSDDAIWETFFVWLPLDMSPYHEQTQLSSAPRWWWWLRKSELRYKTNHHSWNCLWSNRIVQFSETSFHRHETEWEKNGKFYVCVDDKMIEFKGTFRNLNGDRLHYASFCVNWIKYVVSLPGVRVTRLSLWYSCAPKRTQLILIE